MYMRIDYYMYFVSAIQMFLLYHILRSMPRRIMVHSGTHWALIQVRAIHLNCWHEFTILQALETRKPISKTQEMAVRLFVKQNWMLLREQIC